MLFNSIDLVTGVRGFEPLTGDSEGHCSVQAELYAHLSTDR